MEKSEYLIRLGDLKKVDSIWKKISSERATTYRGLQSGEIAAKALLHCGSIINLIENKIDNPREIDASLIASAARNIIDVSRLYFYVSERGLTDDEFNFRIQLHRLHYKTNIINIFEKLQLPLTRVFSLSTKESIIDVIKNNKIYLEASKDEKNAILSGGKLFLNEKPKEILKQEIKSGLFKLLSNSVHGFPLGLGSHSLSRSIVFASQIDAIMLMIISVEVAIIYSANIINDYKLLRKQLNRKLSVEEKAFLKELSKPDYLHCYLAERRDFFGCHLFDDWL